MVKYFKHNGEEIFFSYYNYSYGDRLAIIAYTKEGEPYCDMTVNLPNLPPPAEDEVDIPMYNVEDVYENVFKDAFVEKQTALLPIGMGKGIRVKLKPDFKDNMVERF